MSIGQYAMFANGHRVRGERLLILREQLITEEGIILVIKAVSFYYKQQLNIVDK